MQYYSELIETLPNHSLGFVKVTNPNLNNMQQTEVTMNGNNFFRLGPARCHLSAIPITVAVLNRAGFMRGNGSMRFLSVGQQEIVYSKTYTSGWCLELLMDCQDFYYLKPAADKVEGYERFKVTTIEGLQSEVFIKEQKEFTLSLLNTVLNKKKLKDKLLELYGARYMFFDGPFNGLYVDNDQNRPDFVSLRLDPLNANVDPGIIELHHFNARGCTITILLGGDVIQYTYGTTPARIIQNHPHLQQLPAQLQRFVWETYMYVEEAMTFALTC